MGLLGYKVFLRNIYPFWHNTGVSQTDRHRRTRDKNCENSLECCYDIHVAV